MAETVALLGTFETKPEELHALSNMLTGRGLKVLSFDLSLSSGGDVLPGEEKLRRMAAMVEQTSAGIVEAAPDAVLAIGGGTGSEMALRAMRALPLGLPKFLITTLPFDPRAALADNDVTLIPTLCDIQGMNAPLRRIFHRTATMVAAAARALPEDEATRRAVAVSLLGVTQQAGEKILQRLRDAGQETATFHSNGFGGAALARFAAGGALSGVIDMTVNEIVRMHVAGAHVPMPTRFTCAAALPRIVLPGTLSFLDGGVRDQMPEAYKARPHYRQSSYFTHVQLTEAEMDRAARALAADLNTSSAHCEVLVPMGGFSSEDRPGGAIESLALREQAAEIFEAEARAFTVTRLPYHIADQETADEAVSRLLRHL
ncbi:Tm-1-like ATP-binding domain-containing protein [Tropicimonas sp. IMCC6043]|uniref:Tm-1-like ATP-binding domain-containing protein n=1 Tax=Tropicimonas sp. IMCC6043 TaxID=2510645 RepID=UPI00101BF582|nr:Tm-1-like ATP-binding domain-containing protein [Tropicimonas sp. IMCC6043]RYH07846.1 hypothetical protein EU800_18565 [Tropicimonas sp. IMCC6043]